MFPFCRLKTIISDPDPIRIYLQILSESINEIFYEILLLRSNCTKLCLLFVKTETFD